MLGASQEEHHKLEEHHRRGKDMSAKMTRTEQKKVQGRNNHGECISEPNAMPRKTLWRERGEKTSLVGQQIF